MAHIKKIAKIYFLLITLTIFLVLSCLLMMNKIDQANVSLQPTVLKHTNDRFDFYVLPNISSLSSKPIILTEGFSNSFLSSRMLCTIESAARTHPETDVYVFMNSKYLQKTPITLKIEIAYRNIHFVHLDVKSLLMESNVKDWFLNRMWETSKWPDYHLNDVLRWALLWKYGGIWLDMDVIMLRNIPKEEKNFACLESDESVAVGVVGFVKGHLILEESLRRINKNVIGKDWGAYGPGLLNRILLEKCGMKLPSGKLTRCNDVKIYSPKTFYPIPWQKWREYMKPNKTLAKIVIEDPDVLGLHVWNSFLRTVPINLTQPSPYSEAARKFCPILFKAAGTEI